VHQHCCWVYLATPLRQLLWAQYFCWDTQQRRERTKMSFTFSWIDDPYELMIHMSHTDWRSVWPIRIINSYKFFLTYNNPYEIFSFTDCQSVGPYGLPIRIGPTTHLRQLLWAPSNTVIGLKCPSLFHGSTICMVWLIRMVNPYEFFF